MSSQSIEAIYPLSPVQEGLLFHTLYAPRAGLYCEQKLYRLRGRLHEGAFAAAWRRLLARHPALRSAFLWQELDAPVQVVKRQVELPLTVHDWRGAGDDEVARRLEALRIDDRRRGFDLASAPMMRLALVRTADDAWTLVWSYHHLLFDGWSRGILMRDLALLYAAEAGRGRGELPPPAPYRDYVAWLKGRDGAQAEDYWRRTLAELDGATSLPAEPAAGFGEDGEENVDEAGEGRYGQHVRILSTDLGEALRRLARRHRLTLNTLALGAWALLLSRHVGRRRVVFGATLSGRPAELPGVESMVGLFINTLPVLVEVEPRRTAASWLADLQLSLADLRQHQHSSLVEVQGWSGVGRETPLFDHILVFENFPWKLDGDGVGGGALSIHEVRSAPRTNYPLVVGVEPGSTTALRIAYDRSRYGEIAAGRLLARYAALLAALADGLERPLDALPLLAPAERHQVAVEWPGDRRFEVPGRCAHQLVAEQAARRPDAVAVVFEGRQLTYGELARRAARLARRLRRRGVGGEDLVGIFLDAGLDLVVAFLAVLEAGAAYVGLDPSLPPRRLEWMVGDSGVRVAVTRRGLAGRLPAGLASEKVETLGRGDATPVDSAVGLDGFAYLIYTSGSTGRPKGVVGEHRQLVSYLAGIQEVLGAQPGDRFAVHQSLAVDAPITYLLASLCGGGRLHLVSPEAASDGERYAALLEREPVDFQKVAPSHLAALLAAERPERLMPRRLLMVGGESLRWELVERLAGLAPGCTVLNHYGPTETTVGVLTEAAGARGPTATVPLGRPLAHARIHLQGRDGRPVPIGAVGEIQVAGATVARGYLGRPARTADRFVPDPGAADPGGRLYCTGDLARRLADGRLEFVGRVDHQVKVRGFRVELEEVESVLAEHPAVHAAVVVPWRPRAGDDRLAAYLLAAGAETPPVAQLRAFLGERLPEHMVPAAVRWLDAFPRTPQGKIDRKALPAPRAEAAAASAGRVAPRTPVEEVLAGLWCEVLGIDEVGVDDDFFALGGHSLLATRLISRLRRAFAREVPLRALFERPTVAGLAAVVEKALRDAAPPPPILRPAERGAGPLPLSPAQARLWFLWRLDPSSPAYNIPRALRLTGPLDAALLAFALGVVVERHESLRTTFREDAEGRAGQVVGSVPASLLPLVDLGSLPRERRLPQARRLAGADARRPFDLVVGPLLRAGLLRLDGNDHVLLLNLHHVVSDAWSAGILMREVAGLYAAGGNRAAARLPDLPFQYADFAAWQRGWLETARGALLEHWKKRLDGAPPLLDLPTDRPRSAEGGAAGAVTVRRMPASTARSLAVLARRTGATPFMAAAAVLVALLHRYTGSSDVSLGTPVSGRDRLETEGLIGFFVNTLVLRTRIDGQLGVEALIGRVREASLAAFTHQELPFEELVDALAPRRSLAHSPLFQVLLAYQERPEPAPSLPGLAVRALSTGSGTSKFDWTLNLRRGDGLLAELEYRRDLFDATTVARALEHFERLLAGAAADPRCRVGELPLLSPAQIHQLRVDWNDSRRPYPRERTLPELFAARAALHPDKQALVTATGSVTYRGLAERAMAIARRLRGLGVGPDVLVGLYLDRPGDLLPATYGVLAAGGAYLPLDPSYPEERIATMIEDSNARVVISREAELAAKAPPWRGRVTVLSLDDVDDGGADGGGPAEMLQMLAAAGAGPDNLAYVIYTSGSTGRPKGVQVPHRALVNFLTSVANYPGCTAVDVLLSVTTLSFDIAALELFMPHLVDGTVFRVDRDTASDPHALAAALDASGATVMQATPATWRLLLDGGWEGRRGLTVISGGEALPREMADRLRARAAEVWNIYGPTETTIWSSRHLVDGDRQSVPLGRPLANTTLHVVDGALRLVPVGVAGELVIGGDGVTRGYLGRPRTTAERFVPDPFSGGGRRLYRTGDRVRRRRDGDLDFLGRFDHQVKVRGFRIELGEIETVLGDHPAVAECVVLAREGASGHLRLVAYLVADGAAPSGDVLRSDLGRRLPDHMVPGSYVVLDAMPRTPNGKVDRKALPAPEETAAEHPYRPPAAGAEARLAAVWGRVLGVDRVGADDNFFALGGDSILALQVVARAAREGLHLTLRDIFRHQTLAALAAAAGSSAAAVGDQGAVTGPLPLTPVQRWFFAGEPREPQHWNQSVLLLVRETVEAGALAAAFAALVVHHDALRLRFHHDRDGWRAECAPPGGRPPLTMVDLTALPEARRSAALSAASGALQRGFDLARGPLLAAALFRVAPAEPERLFLVAHHLVVDGVSWRLLLEDLQTAYGAHRADGTVAGLPAKTTSFRRWAEALSELADEPRMRRQLDHWLARLPHRAAGLPLDPGGDDCERAARGITVRLEAEETRELLTAVPETYGTRIEEVLLAAVAEGLAAGTGERRALIDVEGHGREELVPGVDLSRTVGWFTTLHPLFLDLVAIDDPGEVLKAVKEQARAVPDRGAGYGVLRYLTAEGAAALAERPAAQVVFNYFGQLDRVLADASTFAPAPESSGPNRSPRARRHHPLTLNAGISAGRLWCTWTHDGRLRAALVAEMAERFRDRLRVFLEHCRAPQAGGHTPSDFPQMDLAQAELDELVDELSEIAGEL